MADVLDVGLFVGRIDQDVIEVHDVYTIYEATESTIDIRLEGGWRVGQAKRHN